MSLSTRRPAGIPSSVRPSRDRSVPTSRGRVTPLHDYDASPSLPTDNKYRNQPNASRSIPPSIQAADIPIRSHRTQDSSPMPSTPSRHSVQSSMSSSSSGSSAVSGVSTAPSSIWDYVGWKGNQTTSSSEHEERIPSPEPAESYPALVDYNTLWSRMAAVAGGLTISVGKAWEAKDDLPEPHTPPGRDSRVTTALKKHYIKQVSDPRQLPSWLFSDIERQVGRSYSVPERSQGEDRSPLPASQSRARHDDAYVRAQSDARRDRMRTATYDEEHTGPTRAATRLRALRDAKRVPIEREAHVSPMPISEPDPEPEPEPVVAVPPPRPRVGLPSRPVRVKRE